jgi:hypothetical protein
MKKFLTLIIGALALSAIIALTTSCKNDEFPEERTALGFLIAEAELHVESEYTVESWSPFAAARQRAKDVFVNRESTRTDLNSAITNLRTAMRALVKVPAVAQT